jgi:hypothetical protein
MAEREGFEPSMELLTPYSLSRGAPSAARPSLQILFRGPCSMALRTIKGARYSGLRPSPLRGQRRLAPLFFAACSSFASRSAISPNSVSRSVFNGPADHQGSALFGTSSLTPSGPASPCSAVLRCLQQLRQPLGHLSKFCFAVRVQWSCGPSGERVIRDFVPHPFGASVALLRCSSLPAAASSAARPSLQILSASHPHGVRSGALYYPIFFSFAPPIFTQNERNPPVAAYSSGWSHSGVRQRLFKG